jgi:hypothetical protein
MHTNLRRVAGCLLLVLLSGCQGDPIAPGDGQLQLFGPVAMRLHPIFTQVTQYQRQSRRRSAAQHGVAR